MNQVELVSIDKAVTLIVETLADRIVVTLRKYNVDQVFKTEGITSFREFILEFLDNGEAMFNLGQGYYLSVLKGDIGVDEHGEIFKTVEVWLLGPGITRDESRSIFHEREIKKLTKKYQENATQS